MPDASFLTLPAELRVLIYEHHAHDALLTFADTFRLPAMLHLNYHARISEEYADVFFADARIQLYEYHAVSGAWSAINGIAAKMAVFQHATSTFSDLFDRSLASAQRYVERVYSNQSRVRRGILTLSISRVPRWWQWTIVNG